jgi:hypothetical protein
MLGIGIFGSIGSYSERMMSFELFTDAILTADLPEQGLRAGDVGTIVERHDVPGQEVGYSVEFFDMMGQTVAVITIPSTHLRSPTSADRPSTRQMRVR